MFKKLIIFINFIIFIFLFNYNVGELNSAFKKYFKKSGRLYEIIEVKRENNIYCIKIFYFIPQEIKAYPKIGILINLFNDANGVSFNGVRIGGEGSLKNNFILAPGNISVYKIPKNLIRFNRSNLITIKVLNLFYKNKISNMSIKIDDYWKLLYKKEEKVEIQKFSECFLFSILIIALLVIMLIFQKKREGIYLYSGFIILNYLIVLFLESTFFYSSGLKTPLIQKISLAFFSLLPVSILIFLQEILKEKFYYAKLLIVITFLFSIITILFLTLENSGTFFNLWIFLNLIYILTYIILLIKGYKRKTPNIFAISISVLFFIFFITIGNISAIYNLTTENFFLSLYPYDYGVLVFIVSLTYILISRFFKVAEQKEELATKVLNAHEEERKVIASELHDSIGQDLLAIKFNLQKIRDNCKVTELKNTIKELDDCINNVRNIAMGLRPAILDRLGIESTIKYYSDKFKEKTGINIVVKSTVFNRPNPLIEENLFRIFQECLNNILKHAQAKKIEISLFEKKKLFVMEIKDNGKGFNYEKAFLDKKGLGLSIIKDRVMLINGRLYVNSVRSKGTTITIEVPYG